MRFSHLIAVLKNGDAGVVSMSEGHDPELHGAASLERATAHQLSFLEKGNALVGSLENSAAGAVLIPDQQELRELAERLQLAWAVCRDPRLAFAEALEQLHTFYIHHSNYVIRKESAGDPGKNWSRH